MSFKNIFDLKKKIKNVFNIIKTVIFKINFYMKIYQNNIFFYFKKFIFNIKTSKQSKNIIFVFIKILYHHKNKHDQNQYFLVFFYNFNILI